MVLDINLPDMDGFEVCRRIRADPRTSRLPVLHLSATFTNRADYTQGFEAGADSYLTRPVEPPVLIATVQNAAVRAARGFDQAADGRALSNDVRSRARGHRAYWTMRSRSKASIRRSARSRAIRADELVGRPLRGVPERAARNESELEAARSGRDARAVAGRFTFRRKDGSLADIEWQVARERDSGARILVAEDVSAQLQAERARERLLIERARRPRRG